VVGNTVPSLWGAITMRQGPDLFKTEADFSNSLGEGPEEGREI